MAKKLSLISPQKLLTHTHVIVFIVCCMLVPSLERPSLAWAKSVVLLVAHNP